MFSNYFKAKFLDQFAMCVVLLGGTKTLWLKWLYIQEKGTIHVLYFWVWSVRGVETCAAIY